MLREVHVLHRSAANRPFIATVDLPAFFGEILRRTTGETMPVQIKPPESPKLCLFALRVDSWPQANSSSSVASPNSFQLNYSMDPTTTVPIILRSPKISAGTLHSSRLNGDFSCAHLSPRATRIQM